ncbi:MAG: DUF1997 domain-containing protein [Symplocastrum torsivum CPER-KK1]|jgi:hypothetical protein|uniref:DUF1997 domain-containing protein n=1 Tax=Symplocastrum torsivum CPER-KK1 TaxID=450513 RepID=A0A951PHZ4_9CYAN|nr:DUF1997 domain-containing protein [Symplocastrum torsivum CPER-KK1]
MNTQFVASQSVEIAVPEQPVPIQHYLRQPQRLVYAIADSNRIEQLSQDSFRLTMRPLDFMSLKFQPTVDLKVWADADGTVHLTSVRCEIRGLEYINQRFALDLKGKLYPYQKNGTTQLKGRADLKVNVDIPLPFSLTPKPILETTGNGLLKSVLVRIKQKLMHQLLLDYRHWASQDVQTRNYQQTQKLSPADNPII